MDQHSWYIPRPSLSSNSGKKFYHRDSEMLDNNEKGKDQNATMSSTSSSSVVSSSPRSHNNNNNTNKMHITQETCIDCDSPQQHNRGRGSRSSQGSSDSEQSIHSASSLLLTAANLEKFNFAKIQDRHYASSLKILNNFEKIHQNTNASIINIHPNNFLSSASHSKSTKELDQQSVVSIASSTHFTMINGFGRSSMKRKSSYICKRSRQVPLLIITMSFIFLVLLSIAVFLIEMRNREMPR